MEGAAQLGVTVSDRQVRTMGTHAAELLRWNAVTNLTAITDPLEVAIKHYVDSLAAAPLIGQDARILDAGSGGGFPAIPLAILRPDLRITLVDSVRKKVSFLKQAIRTSGLERVAAVHGRLEDLGQTVGYAGAFDMVVCRAFASLEDFAERTMAFLSSGGSLLALKGPRTEHPEEAAGGRIHLNGLPYSIHTEHYQLPVLGSQRRAVRLTPRTEDGGRRAEDGGLRTEDREPMTEN
jgi:16S rRNA (guanine527-N7)-methyltransferase